MSGRIPPDRPGYDGYDCDPIPPVIIDCVDCVDNDYQAIPKSLPGEVLTADWVDYQSTPIPSTYTHVCPFDPDDPTVKGILAVEYPDVAPVSVRGIHLYRAPTTPTKCGMFTVEKVPGGLVRIFDENDPSVTQSGYLLIDITQIKVSVHIEVIPGGISTAPWYIIAKYHSDGKTAYFDDFAIINQTDFDVEVKPCHGRTVIATITQVSGVHYIWQEHCGPIIDKLTPNVKWAKLTSISSRLSYVASIHAVSDASDTPIQTGATVTMPPHLYLWKDNPTTGVILPVTLQGTVGTNPIVATWVALSGMGLPVTSGTKVLTATSAGWLWADTATFVCPP